MAEQFHMQRTENEKMGKRRQKMLLELSCDIKTPVAAIKSCACALEEGMVPKEELPARVIGNLLTNAKKYNERGEEYV